MQNLKRLLKKEEEICIYVHNILYNCNLSVAVRKLRDCMSDYMSYTSHVQFNTLDESINIQFN